MAEGNAGVVMRKEGCIRCVKWTVSHRIIDPRLSSIKEQEQELKLDPLVCCDYTRSNDDVSWKFAVPLWVKATAEPRLSNCTSAWAKPNTKGEMLPLEG